MNWEDTVMDNEGIVKATWVNPNYPQDSPVMRLSTPSEIGIAQVQAKISYEAGVREVVDWFNKHTAISNQFIGGKAYTSYRFKDQDLQAKLKEWGYEG
ncbi:unnamed protein product [marine sediment metagenome]|uniref:Uncharacterized protein n=1 Tax=marine sediment metagenome TaxID=412755 RepID=X1PYC2_9ZZZZ